MELRTDPITGRQVAFAPERAERPFEFSSDESSGDREGRCPLCLGNEDMTPEAVLQTDASGQPSSDWSVRSIPNRYPAFSAEAASVEQASLAPQLSPCEVASSRGQHEVLIESPEHCCLMSELSPEQFRRVVEMYRQRLLTLQDDGGLAHILIFKNQGNTSGASLEHVHSQLVGMPFVPRTVDEELKAASSFAARSSNKCSLWSEMVDHERHTATRIVHETDLFTVLCPFASRFPYETWLVPRRARPEFTKVDSGEMEEFAGLLHRTLTAIEETLPLPAYNFALCTAPLQDRRAAAYHWHLKITPRIAGIAGFEIGTGGWINIVMPEHAAASLRNSW